MNLSQQMAKHIRDVHFGGNWTVSSLKEHLADVNWQEATTSVHSFQPIANLVYHIHYFVNAALKVLQGGPLDAHDKFSFDRPSISSQADWEQLLDRTWADAEEFASLVEKLPESKLLEDFVESKYGNYYRNIAGIVEHAHYHLGQIVLIKKMIGNAEQH